MEYGNGPRASPTVHDGRVYTLGTQGDLCCLDAATGKPFWQKDLEQEYDADIPRYGASVAPLIEGDLPGHTSRVTSAAFSPDGTTLATGSADQTIRLWNTADGNPTSVLKGHTDAVWTLAYIDNQTLISAGWDGTLRFWNPATAEELASLTGHDGEILSVAVSPDGTMLVTGRYDCGTSPRRSPRRLWRATMDRSIALPSHQTAKLSPAAAVTKG